MELITSKIDISILQRLPRLDDSIILEIQPLAPLSMVSELPGSYYKALKMPDKKMICGLIENVLGWHIDLSDRKEIAKEIKKMRDQWVKQQKKQKNSLFKSDQKVIPYTDYSKGSTYLPLLMDYFEIENITPIISNVVFYEDLWNRAYRRDDVSKSNAPHPKGTFNIDYKIIPAKRELERDKKDNKRIDDTALGLFFSKHKSEYPMFYSIPTSREYIAMRGKFEINVNIDEELFVMLQGELLTNNLCYLGNSESWVDLKIKKL